ncbi:MAG: hypothetical protein GXX96_38600 [Planctomycetaceae bacterium]|nr:hypothetical protein [Planctomycetaceae bacterium]
MTTGQMIIMVIGLVILAAVVVAVFVASLFGRDTECFERYRTANPKYYRNLKGVCRFNSPLTAILSVGGIIAAPFVAFHPGGGILPAAAVLVGSAMFLWLSVRWFFWSLKP